MIEVENDNRLIQMLYIVSYFDRKDFHITFIFIQNTLVQCDKACLTCLGFKDSAKFRAHLE